MEWVRLGDVAEVTSGKNAPKENEFNLEGHPFIRAGHLDSLIDGLDENKLPLISNDTAKKKKYKLYDPTTIIFAKSGMSILKDRVYTLKNPSYIVNHLAAIELKNNNINNDFIKYQLRYIKPSSLIKGESYPSISLTDIKNLKLFLPTIEKQNKIVNTLNELKKITEIRKEQIQAYDDLIESLFINMFDNPNYNTSKLKIKKLAELGEWKSGGTPKRSNKEYYKGNIPWVTSGELNEIFIANSIEHINEIAIENSSTKKVPVGSLLLGMYDSAGLKSSITTRVVTTNQAIAFSKLNEELVNTIYVYYCIQLMRDNLLTKQRGVRQKNFNLSMIRDIDIPVPPIELQNKFADYVIKIEEEKKKLKSSLKELEDLFDALMQEAFSGNLFKD